MKKVERETFIKDKPMAQLIACEAQIHHKPRVSISNMYSDAYTYYICSNTYPIIFMIFGKQKKSSSGRRFLGPPPDAMPPTAPPQNMATPSSRGAAHWYLPPRGDRWAALSVAMLPGLWSSLIRNCRHRCRTSWLHLRHAGCRSIYLTRSLSAKPSRNHLCLVEVTLFR